ncbi:major facilitator superfamily protein [Hirsutella rhossiliensis]|uniref:Major facilitator superfamily domain-containing protein n=1 Tax=Hirsutella rhossiliensis TaxID=111463 RepID=A0A9P8MTG9_9HYPO|nr:major facilitator superfamily domain-containing protein [Hirsutella rhossiliensis]KAH0961718.1 major facilitator superfamily domain-containing protein [Hirsutella rhossiliensis]
MSTTPWNKPILARQRSSSNFIVTTVSVAVFTDIFLYAVIIPVLPFALTDRIGIPKDDVQHWVSVSLAVFAAAVLCSSPTFGYVADCTQSRRIPMLLGLVLLLGTSLLLCFSTNIAMLLIGRVLQGMSAAMVWSVGLALVVDAVDGQKLGEAMGWVGSATSFGTLVAPLLGGLVYSGAGYYSVFAMCFALIALDVVLRLCIIEPKDAKRWLKAQEPEREPLIAEADGIGTRERRDQPNTGSSAETNATERPTSPSLKKLAHLLSKPRLLAALFGTVIESGVQTCFDSTLPLFVSSTFGWEATGAGLVFLALILPTFLGPFAGALSDRYGPKWPATIGLLAAAPLLVCLRFVTENTIGHQVLLCALLAGIGLSLTFVFGPLMAEITWAIQEGSDDPTVEPYALVYGLHTMSFSVGGILGPVLGGLIRDRLGWPTMGLVFGVANVVASVVQIIWTGGPLRLSAGQSA